MNSKFAIIGSCQKRWTDLSGDGPKRFCDTCQTHVHAIEQYSPEEWDKIWRESSGHVCGYIAAETPVEHRSRRAVLVGALLTAVSPLFAQTGRIRIRVLDSTDTPIKGARVSIVGAGGEPIQTASTGGDGFASLADLPIGDCRIRVECSGFATWQKTIVVLNRDEVRVGAVLAIASLGTTVEILSPASGPPVPPPGRIRVRVLDPSGAAIQGAMVSLIPEKALPTRSEATGRDGEVSWIDLPVGHYSVRVEAPGFISLIRDGLALTNAEELKVDAKLKVGGSMGSVLKKPRWWQIFY